MLERAEATVARRSAERCYDVFCEPRYLTAWLPGLRRATVVQRDAAGLPLEVKFELGESWTYSLRYEYDAAAHVVRWTPGTGAREAVSGAVRFDDDGAGGCRVTYDLAAGAARPDGASAEAVLSAFVRWIDTLP